MTPHSHHSGSDDLRWLLAEFIRSPEASYGVARRLESAVDVALSGESSIATDALEELQHVLSMYAPGGGEYLYSWDQALPFCLEAINRLETAAGPRA